MKRYSVLAVLVAAMLVVGGGIVASVGSAFSLAFGGPSDVAWTSTPSTLVDRQFDLGTTTKLVIIARNLDIQVVPSASPGSGLRVHGRVPAGIASRIAFARTGSTATLTLVPEHHTSSWSISVFEERKPLFVSLDDTRQVEVVSTSGDVALENWLAPLTVETTSGDVRLTAPRANATIHTTSGDLRATDVLGRLAVRTTSGDAQVAFTAISSDASFVTSSGDVDLRVPQSVRAALVTSTSSGDVDNSAALPSPFSGMPTIKATTSSGDITVHR